MGRLGNLIRAVSPRGADLLGRVYNDVVHLKYRGAPISEVFRDIHERNHWKSSESVSGPGSSLLQTDRVRAWLPMLLKHLDAKSMLDLPCGDFSWLSTTQLPLERYIGGDIVEALVKANQLRYADARHSFEVLDVTRAELPQVDLIFCRDCLVHLSYADGAAALGNLKRSGSRWLLTTTFTRHGNRDITTGNWRRINLEAAPYSLGVPVLLLYEGCTEGDGANADKALALYDLHTLNR